MAGQSPLRPQHQKFLEAGHAAKTDVQQNVLGDREPSRDSWWLSCALGFARSCRVLWVSRGQLA